MSFGARHFTDAPSPLIEPASAFHARLNCSTGVSSSFTLAERVISLSTSTRSELSAIPSITGARLTEGPPDDGTDGDCGATGVALCAPPHADAARTSARAQPATTPRLRLLTLTPRRFHPRAKPRPRARRG